MHAQTIPLASASVSEFHNPTFNESLLMMIKHGLAVRNGIKGLWSAGYPYDFT